MTITSIWGFFTFLADLAYCAMPLSLKNLLLKTWKKNLFILITIKRWRQSTLVNDKFALENGQEMGWFFALNNSDLNWCTTQSIVNFNGL